MSVLLPKPAETRARRVPDAMTSLPTPGYRSAAAFAVLAALVALIGAVLAPAAPAAAGPVRLSARWPLNGIDQAVVIRGDKPANPVLIWVGDLWCETPALRRYQASLEHDFTVVYWCQRYSGASFDPFAPRPMTLALADYVSDLSALTARVRTQLGVERVVIVAHSSGTAIGLRYAAETPADVAAYVGVGQVIDARQNEVRAYRWTLAEAQRRHDAEALAELQALGPPPFPPGGAGTLRKWVVAYGGAFHNGLTYGALARQSALSGYAGWRDLAAAALADSYTAPLNPELAAARFQGPGARYAVPVFLASGAFDHRSDPGLAAQFIDDISAPAKAFVRFPNSAHSPPFEEPEAFRDWLVKTVRPLAPPAAPPHRPATP